MLSSVTKVSFVCPPPKKRKCRFFNPTLSFGIYKLLSQDLLILLRMKPDNTTSSNAIANNHLSLRIKYKTSAIIEQTKAM